MNDLAARLRQIAGKPWGQFTGWPKHPCLLAAERIEELEAELLKASPINYNNKTTHNAIKPGWGNREE